MVYLRIIKDSSITIRLLMENSKVAPIKSISQPRLELCVAFLLTILIVHSHSEFA